MKFEIGDDTDKALVQTLVHEMMLCKEAWNAFLDSSVLTSQDRESKIVRVKTYNAYSTFLHHIYEFYVGCIKRDRRNTENLGWEELDAVFDFEAEKQLRNRRILVENGVIDDKKNLHIYTRPLQPGFGLNFRNIRNHTAHASIKRVTPAPGHDLNSFFKNYHFVILLLFFNAKFSWNLRDPEDYNWGPLEEFDFGHDA